MRVQPGELVCLVEGLSHAWVPETPPSKERMAGTRYKCGRCHITRVIHDSGYVSYWQAPRSPARSAED